jgi:phospholipid/cholesterol/gamma-HCH transport system ATP-binding protein
VLINADLSTVAATDDAWIRDYFLGPRGRAAAASHAEGS